jgi:hypothetical protein
MLSCACGWLGFFNVIANWRLSDGTNLFTEHWTPEVAAAGYDFDGFEIKGGNIVLHGVENACGFIYRINVTLPMEIIDNAAAIEAYFQRQLSQSKAESELTTATSGPTDPVAL